jgi:hypothetical protein
MALEDEQEGEWKEVGAWEKRLKGDVKKKQVQTLCYTSIPYPIQCQLPKNTPQQNGIHHCYLTAQHLHKYWCHKVPGIQNELACSSPEFKDMQHRHPFSCMFCAPCSSILLASDILPPLISPRTHALHPKTMAHLLECNNFSDCWGRASAELR